MDEDELEQFFGTASNRSIGAACGYMLVYECEEESSGRNGSSGGEGEALDGRQGESEAEGSGAVHGNDA